MTAQSTLCCISDLILPHPPAQKQELVIKASWQWHIFHKGLPPQYRLRWGVSLPCSGWERVLPPRSNHQEALDKPHT